MDTFETGDMPDPLYVERLGVHDIPTEDTPTSKPDMLAALACLATMSTLEYERVRKAEAKALGFRPSVLDAEVQRLRVELEAAASTAGPNPAEPEPLSGADVALAIAELSRLDSVTYMLARRREAKRLGLSVTELDGLVQRERRRAEAEAKADADRDDAEPTPTDPRGRADLFVNKADLPETAHELAAILARRPMLFDRGVPVRLAMDTQRNGLVAEPLTLNGVVNEMHNVARPWTYVKGRQDELQRADITLPERVAKLYLDLRGKWQLRPLDGIALTPLLAE